jgi:hypothetical protein
MTEAFDSQECFVLELGSKLGIIPKRKQLF